MSTALASLALASCTAAAPPAQTSFTKAQAALEDGKVDRAIMHAEAAVLAEPRNAGYRAMLGSSYLKAGRFQSAATAFGDAIELGDTNPRTILSYALTKVATGDNNSALQMLAEHEAIIPAADLGLALALAGQPERGVHYLVNTVRNGQSDAKARQNLAYAYALAGNWRAARVMAAEDVPANQLDARLSDWAATARAEDYQLRVSSLLGVSPVGDAGQPQQLALANFPSQEMMVAEAEEARADELNVDVASAPAQPSQSEALAFGLRDIDTVAVNEGGDVETVDPTPVQAAPAPAQVSMPAVAAAPARSAPRFVSNAVVQQVPATSAREAASAPARAAAPAAARRVAVATGAADTHLVQLGSFESRVVAESKWSEMQRRFPDLKGRDVVITEAKVRGKTYFRVAAAGFSSRTARTFCGTMKSAGRGCFAYAASNPPAGAVDRGVRIAARTR